MNYILPPIKKERTNFIDRWIDEHRGRLHTLIKLLYKRNLIPDKLFLTLMYRLRIGRWMSWKNPITLTEKLQWLKLYDRKPVYTDIVDKIKFKKWVASKIGEEYIIPTLGVWDKPEDIEFDKLPSTFVLKCNHASGYNYIHANAGNVIEKEKIIKCLNQRFKMRWDKNSGEWPYRNVEPKILAEEYLYDDSFNELPDYKLLCFHGEPKFVQVFSWDPHYITDTEESRNQYNVFYDMEWKKQEFIQGYPYNNNFDFDRPKNFDKMIDIARKLSKNIPFVRVDFYNIKGKIYVGELTFFPYGGFSIFTPDRSWDNRIGNLINLENLKK